MKRSLGDNKAYLTWEGFDVNLNDIDSQEGLYEILMEYNLENENCYKLGISNMGYGT